MPSAVKAFYEATGGDYADAVARFSSEARLIRFLRKFPADDSFRSLSACLQTNDTAGAIFSSLIKRGKRPVRLLQAERYVRPSQPRFEIWLAGRRGGAFRPPSRGIPHHRFLCFRHAGQGIYLIILT